MRVDYYSADGIESSFNQDLNITNCEIRDGALSSNSPGLFVNFYDGGSAGQSIYGLYISGLRVYSEDANDGTNAIINLNKQDYDSIDAAVITNCIGRGFSTGVKNSGELGSNTHTDGIVTA
jgi:hypothetical protein